jgi:hypothetical protein
MHFDANDLHELKELIKFRTDILHVRKCTGGPKIAFSTEQFVALQGEVVIETGILVLHFGHKGGKEGFDFIELAFVNLEVGMNTDDVALIGHGARLL